MRVEEEEERGLLCAESVKALEGWLGRCCSMITLGSPSGRILGVG